MGKVDVAKKRASLMKSPNGLFLGKVPSKMLSFFLTRHSWRAKQLQRCSQLLPRHHHSPTSTALAKLKDVAVHSGGQPGHIQRHLLLPGIQQAKVAADYFAS